MSGRYHLPRAVPMDNLRAFLHEVRDRPNANMTTISQYVPGAERAKQACVEVGLVLDKGGDVSLTPAGAELAWAQPDQEPDLWLKHVVLTYAPYEVILKDNHRGWKAVLSTDDIRPVWAQRLGIKLGKQDMSKSAATMFGIMEQAGLGNYVIGRGGKPTRIEFNGAARHRVGENLRPNAARTTTAQEEQETPTDNEKPTDALAPPHVNVPPSNHPRHVERMAASFGTRHQSPRDGASSREVEVYQSAEAMLRIIPTHKNVAWVRKILEVVEMNLDDEES